MYKKSVLNNGLKVISHAMPQRQSAACGIWIRTGGRYEPQRIKGIAHFMEHLLFKGSRQYSCRKIKESIEGVGGSLNGFTSEELTCFLVKIPAGYFDPAINILSDMVINPLLKQSDIQKERTVILEEIKMYKDLPQSYVHELLDELMWPGQPLGGSILGTYGSVGGMKREDLRSFQKHYYTASNIVVSASGRIKHDGLVKRISRNFSSLPAAVPCVFPAARNIQAGAKLKILHKDTEQTHLALGFYSFKRDHALKHALALLNIILGANMSSRLFNEVREKRGLAYEIATAAKRFQDTGAFVVHAGIDNRKVIPAIAVILKELSKIKKNPVRTGEFRRARDFYLGQLVLALEDTLDNMLWIGENTAALDKALTVKKIVDEVNKVRPKDVQEAAGYIFREENLNLALIGPLDDKRRPIEQELKLG